MSLKRAFERRYGSFFEIVSTAWENRDRLPYAWRILNQGVCDGCALGTAGMKDWTIPGIHLCWIRLNLLRLNTMPPFEPEILSDVSQMVRLKEKDLRKLGRLPAPMVRRNGDAGFRRIDWDEAISIGAERLAQTDPHRIGFYVVSRGTLNESYYAIQKAARALGTNNVDNSARICHAPSSVALKQMIGYGATTCSYTDLFDTDLIVLIGSDAANNQPVFMKYLEQAKKKGAKVAVINPYREPGLDRYWVPSSVKSALLGTKIGDFFFGIRVGGDIAFMTGALKSLIESDLIDQGFIQSRTQGWEEIRASISSTPWEEIERGAGCSRSEIEQFAEVYGRAEKAILVWSMGVTMHSHGTDNVRSIVNLGLSRGMVGRPGCGLMPIRGHSGVQGGAEMGAVPNGLPGAISLNERAHLEALWGFDIPSEPGLFVADMVDAAHNGDLDVLYCAGGNLTSVLPDPGHCRRAIGNIPLRIHHDIVLNPQMLVDPSDTVLLLPATARYETYGTETSTERRVIFSPEVSGPRVIEAREEWRAVCAMVSKARPEIAKALAFSSPAEIMAEIAQAAPMYDGIQHLSKAGDQFQWGGPMLCERDFFGRADGRARFVVISMPQSEARPGMLRLTTRRGKQFNSMVFKDRDSTAGADRNSILMNEQDMMSKGIEQGDLVKVSNEQGALRLAVRASEIQPGQVMAFWPEANALIARGERDPECGIPAYRDCWVTIERDDL
ncbi:MAG: FdhF/YdeP family oxidoreductase [Armatimonadetes bacterium]|nr:FdhF/YdeP family oxidoreductase [Armatimonadota bacterium]